MKYLDEIGLTHLFEKLRNLFVKSDIIRKIVVVDEYPAIEENGVLYLKKSSSSEGNTGGDTGGDTPSTEYVEYPTMEFGDISRAGVLSDSTSYVRTKEYVYVKDCNHVTLTNGTGSSTRVLCYNANKEFMENWYEGGTLSYAQVNDGGTFSIPNGCKYIKCRLSSTELVNFHVQYN